MGIVVSLSMLLLLTVLRPSPWNGEIKDQSSARYFAVAITAGFVFGAWNAFYGVRHLSEFWGLAALVSGLLMLVSALVLLLERIQGYSPAALPRALLVAGLVVCFLLYVITIIQINLGLPYLYQ